MNPHTTHIQKTQLWEKITQAANELLEETHKIFPIIKEVIHRAVDDEVFFQVLFEENPPYLPFYLCQLLASALDGWAFRPACLGSLIDDVRQLYPPEPKLSILKHKWSRRDPAPNSPCDRHLQVLAKLEKLKLQNESISSSTVAATSTSVAQNSRAQLEIAGGDAVVQNVVAPVVSGNLLHQAILNRNVKLIEQALLKLDPTAAATMCNQSNKLGQTPLHLAVFDPALVGLLLEKKADPNIEDARGFTPLHVAVEKNQVQSFSRLVNGGGDLHKATAQITHQNRTERYTCRELATKLSFAEMLIEIESKYPPKN